MSKDQNKVIFLSTTYVDYKTNIPMNEQPARHGHKIPDGIIPVFDLSEERGSEKPVVFGWAEEGFEALPYMNEITEDSFWEIFKEELKDRVQSKRWQVETGGVSVGEGVVVGTTLEDQNRITSVVANARLAGVESVDFKADSGWTTLSVDEVEGVAAVISLHVQGCFSWARSMFDAIDALNLSLESVGDTLPILESINSFGQEEFLEEEMPEEEGVEGEEEPLEDEEN